MNKYRCQDSVRRKCDVGHCDGIYYGNDCECAKINDKAAEEPTATNFQRHFGTVEAAAKFIRSTENLVLPYCKNLSECSAALDNHEEIPEEKCRDCLTDWLNAPVEDGE